MPWLNKNQDRIFQSPPELGDLGGLAKSQRRQLDLCLHGSLYKADWGRSTPCNKDLETCVYTVVFGRGARGEGLINFCVT